jgi:hypothetical protein
MDLVGSMKECIIKAVEKLEWMGWHRDSVKGIGERPFLASGAAMYSRITH